MWGLIIFMKRSVPTVARPPVTIDRDPDASELFKKTILITIVIPLLILFFSELVLYCLGFDDPLRGKPNDRRIQTEFSASNSDVIATAIGSKWTHPELTVE